MLVLILHDIRSEENVGSMFRSADAFGVERVFLTGYTPAPLDRFKRPVHKIAKTALGAELSVPWEKCELAACVAHLRNEGARIIALEQDEHAIELGDYAPPQSWALVVGNEVLGLEPEVLALADDVVEIPMLGTKESLNVAVAAGITLYQLSQAAH